MTLLIPAIERVVEIDGSPLHRDADAYLASVVVVDRLAMPDTFQLAFHDPDRDILSRAGLAVGRKVRISTTSPTSDVPEILIDGEVTSLEAEYDLLGTQAVVRGYDLSHRLASGRKTATYQNATYSDIARQIATDAGLEAEVEDSGAAIEHVLQPNLSDLDFLYGLARLIGFDCRVEGQKLLFKRPTPATSAPAPPEGDHQSVDPTQLVWGDSLLEFRARMTAASQVAEVKVRGWDVGAKEAVIGKALASGSNDISMSPADLAATVGDRTLVVVDRPVDTQAAADQIAQARAAQVGSAAFEATAVVVGSPALKAGVAVNIANVDPALNGSWVISSSRHEFGSGAYRTTLEFSGRQDRSLHGLVTGGQAGGGRAGAVPGVVNAVVTSVDDEEGLGRVKVRYPWLADDAESSWCRLAMPGAGREYGMVWVPQLGDEVVVAFMHGDFAHPIVVGALWNGKDPAPLGEHLFDQGAVRRSGFISRRGHKLVFFDAEDDTGIALISAENSFRVSLNETSGRLHIWFDGDLVIDGTGDVRLKTGGSIAIEAGGTLDLEAGGRTTVKGSVVALNP